MFKNKQEQDDLETIRKAKIKSESIYSHQREIAAVASSFSAIFSSTKKLYHYTPVHAQQIIHTSAYSNNDSNKQLEEEPALNSPKAQTARKKQKFDLYKRHHTLSHSDSAHSFLPSSLHDCERHGNSTPFQTPPLSKHAPKLNWGKNNSASSTSPTQRWSNLKKNHLSAPTAFVSTEIDNEIIDNEIQKVEREAKFYLDLCCASNVAPISKLLKALAPLRHRNPRKQRQVLKEANRLKKHVDLHGKGLTVHSLNVMAKSILPNFAENGLQKLNLSENQDLTTKGVNVLLETLDNGKAPKLQEIDLSSCNLRNNGALKAVTLLSPEAQNNLSCVKLANNGLNDDFVLKFCAMYKSFVPARRIADLSRLVHLDLRRNDIGVRGGLVLGSAIGECGSALETLLLGWNKLRSQGAREILRGFVQVKPVTRISVLDLSFNNISDDMLLPDNSLQAFLGGSRTLTLISLDLSHNNLGPATAEDLVTALSIRNRVQELRIGFNPLGLAGTARILEVSRQNALRTLMIENTIIKMQLGTSSGTDANSTNGGEDIVKQLIGGGDNTEEDGEDELDNLDHFDLTQDTQYIWELAQRVKRAKAVLLMMRVRRKYNVIIEVEHPAQDRSATNRLFTGVMGWLSGRARRDHGVGEGGQGKSEKDEKTTTKTDSVFHTRIAESESRSFWDSPHVIGAAFEEDWIKLSHHKIVKLNFTEENQVHDALKSHFVLLKELFHYYSASKSGRAKGGFSITMNAAKTFVEECKIWPNGKEWPKSKLDMIFIQSAVDKHKQDEHLTKKKRAKYLHADMDDNFSLGSGTGLNSVSLAKLVSSKRQIEEVHAVRLKLAAEQQEQAKQRNKSKKKKKAKFHEDDSATKKQKKAMATAKTQASLITTMKQKKKKKKKDSKSDKKSKSAAAAAERMKERKKKREADGKEKTKAGGRSFGAHALSRSEFLGFIFRLAIERFYNSNEVTTAKDAVNKAMEDFIIPNAFKDIGGLCEPRYLFDRNMFRDEKLYFVEIDQVIRDNYLALQAIYAKFSTDDSVGASENFTYKGRFKEGDVMKLQDFVKLIASMDNKKYVEACSRRAIVLSFVFSQMLCSGEDDAASQASFCEFLEALARLSDMCMNKELKGLRIPLSVSLRQMIESLVAGNQKDVDKFGSRMEKETAAVAKNVSSSAVNWSNEARSSSLDMTMAWMKRVKNKVKEEEIVKEVTQDKKKKKK